MDLPGHYADVGGDVQTPRGGNAAHANHAAIAAGVVQAGSEVGIGRRKERSRAANDIELEPPPPRLPDLNLVLFADGETDDAPPPAKENLWAAVQPRSYIDWAYRSSPWHGRKSDAALGEDHDGAADDPPWMSRHDGPCWPWSELESISEVPELDGKFSRPCSATPTYELDSTRAPSRATQASPDFPFAASQAHDRRSPSPDAASRIPSPEDKPEQSPAHRTTESELARQLGLAAEAAGAQARGSVTLAIRARAICRAAASGASRRLLHLNLNGGQEKVQLPSQAAPQPNETTRSSSKDKAKGRGPNLCLDTVFKDDGQGSKTSTFEFCPVLSMPTTAVSPRKKRVIRVAHNTALGRMASKDLARASKYDIVVVPAWQHNKPWPPPPVRTTCKRLQHAKPKAPSEEDKDNASVPEGSPPKVSHLARKSWKKMGAMNNVLSLRPKAWQSQASFKSSPSRKAGARLSFDDTDFDVLSPRGDSKDNVADLETAATILSLAEKGLYKGIYVRHAKPPRNKLTREGMQRAMDEANLAPSCPEEQKKFAAVQQQIMNHCRDHDAQEDDNPLTNPLGVWELDEFILMVSALRELMQRQMTLSNRENAKEFGYTESEVVALRSVFMDYDDDQSGSINLTELQSLLNAVKLKTTEEDLFVILASVDLDGVENLDFKQFLKITNRVDEFLHPNGAKAQARKEGSMLQSPPQIARGTSAPAASTVRRSSTAPRASNLTPRVSSAPRGSSVRSM